MTRWLSPEWFEETRRMQNESQPERPGMSATLNFVVTGGPDGDVRYFWELQDGRLVRAELGQAPGADVTLTQTYDDAKKIQQGELDANAAFMQGRVKVAGDMAKVLALLPLTSAADYLALQDDIRRITDY